MVEWETREITEEPLSIIAKDDPVTCAAYAKEHNVLHLPKWNKLKDIAKQQKPLTRAINQTMNRQVGKQQHINLGTSFQETTNMPWNWTKYGNSRWYDATKMELNQINEYQVFIHNQIKEDHECTSGIPEDQGTPGFCL